MAAEIESRALYYREQARRLRLFVMLTTNPSLRAELFEIAQEFERRAAEWQGPEPTGGRR